MNIIIGIGVAIGLLVVSTLFAAAVEINKRNTKPR